MFTSGISLKELWAGIQPAKARLWPHLPAVGYEDGTSLEAARQAGFHALGSFASGYGSSPHPDTGRPLVT